MKNNPIPDSSFLLINFAYKKVPTQRRAKPAITRAIWAPGERPPVVASHLASGTSQPVGVHETFFGSSHEKLK